MSEVAARIAEALHWATAPRENLPEVRRALRAAEAALLSPPAEVTRDELARASDPEVLQGHPDTSRKPDADEAVRIARAATAHNFGETVYEASDASGILRLRMSSWPRAKEAVKGLADAGYRVAQDGNEVMVLAAPAAARPSQPVQVEVTDEMVERAVAAWWDTPDEGPGAQGVAMRAALTAALGVPVSPESEGKK